MKHLFTVVLLLIMLTSCGNGKKKTSTPKSSYYEYSEPRKIDQPSESNPDSMKAFYNVPIMSQEEDAYEEGRSLAEEHWLLGFRSLRFLGFRFICKSNKPQTCNLKPNNLKPATSNLQPQTCNLKPATSNL